MAPAVATPRCASRISTLLAALHLGHPCQPLLVQVAHDSLKLEFLVRKVWFLPSIDGPAFFGRQ